MIFRLDVRKVMEHNGTKWNTLERFGTFWNTQRGEQMQEQTNEIIQTESAEKVSPSAVYENKIYELVDDLKQDKQVQGLTDEEIKNHKYYLDKDLEIEDIIYNWRDK